MTRKTLQTVLHRSPRRRRHYRSPRRPHWESLHHRHFLRSTSLAKTLFAPLSLRRNSHQTPVLHHDQDRVKCLTSWSFPERVRRYLLTNHPLSPCVQAALHILAHLLLKLIWPTFYAYYFGGDCLVFYRLSLSIHNEFIDLKMKNRFHLELFLASAAAEPSPCFHAVIVLVSNMSSGSLLTEFPFTDLPTPDVRVLYGFGIAKIRSPTVGGCMLGALKRRTHRCLCNLLFLPMNRELCGLMCYERTKDDQQAHEIPLFTFRS